MKVCNGASGSASCVAEFLTLEFQWLGGNPVRLKMTVKVYLLEDDIEKNNFKRPELISTLFLQKLVQGPLGFVPHDEQCYKGNYDKHIRSNLQ